MVCRLCPSKHCEHFKGHRKVMEASIIASLLTGQFHRANTEVLTVQPLGMVRDDMGGGG